ncbi:MULTISPECIES: hypothetical protein [Burkholderia]|nr:MULTISPECIES: hypothetical protein [Burkholderia]MCC5031361.1 hypothetical protein [Burkholderia dolosa]UEB56369.1 hypothetical protein LK423_26860 [Burkholderia dolosa]UEC12337.1 hypothetical protein LK445_01455 [Burkholderia dolosa]
MRSSRHDGDRLAVAIRTFDERRPVVRARLRKQHGDQQLVGVQRRALAAQQERRARLQRTICRLARHSAGRTRSRPDSSGARRTRVAAADPAEFMRRPRGRERPAGVLAAH